ncbi:MAG: hypothetical protein IPJ13_19895 [Saprospiraceae bacterium]|nr:hypothetical protein [Saprospiraceae bacterium]
MTLSQIEKLHLRQQDQSDCGVACLLMALKYHGGSASMERLREVSGTTKTGTTLLGLIQGGAQVGHYTVRVLVLRSFICRNVLTYVCSM